MTEARLAAYRRAGVNRLSFGVQSFRDDELRRLSRLHSADRARAAFGEARAAGFDNVSLDLMMWLPRAARQRVARVDRRGDRARPRAPVALHARGLSERAAQGRHGARALVAGARTMTWRRCIWRRWSGWMRQATRQHEISNVARPGRRSRHNLKYWTDGEWLGFGCGAHSTRAGVRWKNISSTAGVHRSSRSRAVTLAVDVRRLTPDERLGDALFTGLRLVDGIDVNAIQTRYGVDVWRRFGADLEPFLEAGCLRRDWNLASA